MKRRQAFTLVELLVVIGIIAVLVGILLPTLTRVRAQAARVECLTRLRNLGQAVTMYANSNRGKMPVHTATGMSWLWDISVGSRDALVRNGATRPTFYCPAYREQDQNGLWDFRPNNFGVVGYYLLWDRGPGNPNMPDLATYGKRQYIDKLYPSIAAALKRQGAPTKAAEIELAADGVIRKGTQWAADGGYLARHVTPHMSRNAPTGANVLFLDGHVILRRYKPVSTVDGGEIKLRAQDRSGVQFWF